MFRKNPKRKQTVTAARSTGHQYVEHKSTGRGVPLFYPACSCGWHGSPDNVRIWAEQAWELHSRNEDQMNQKNIEQAQYRIEFEQIKRRYRR